MPSKRKYWHWEEAKEFAEYFFCVWTEKRDLKWLSKNWDKFNWAYGNDLGFHRLKLNLITLANIYYEFCHEAYDITYEIILDDIGDFNFSPIIIGQLLGDSELLNVDNLEDYSFQEKEEFKLQEAIYKLIQRNKYSMFEELMNIFGDNDDIYDEFVSIIPSYECNSRGYDYIIHQGETYSNFI